MNQEKPKLTKEQEEAKAEASNILKDIEKKKCKLPDVNKNILDWTTEELRAYILKEIAGKGTKYKLKFARDLDKRIKEEKERRKKENGLQKKEEKKE